MWRGGVGTGIYGDDALHYAHARVMAAIPARSLGVRAVRPAEEAVGGDEELARGKEEGHGHLRRQDVVVVNAVDCDLMAAITAAANERRQGRREASERDDYGAKGGRRAVQVRFYGGGPDQDFGIRCSI